ncbi:polysaccharide biosynthesis protein GtrA [Vibrio albus]|uniref:Polysaccharide biosynthesis protein GtrA n=1 Tax=Vibrio albus TaxID=2200953 RepID=A0A2U3BBN0_9VIBR|nr:polysaccharide biosynthesis protein GtrA [Vibrio albus]
MRSTFFRFAFVGGVGFLVDSAVFGLAWYLFSVPVHAARVISFVCAATATWWGNRIFTFDARERNIFRQWASFFSSACVSAIPNFLVFSVVIYLFGRQDIMPFVALVCGTLTGMVSNYLLCKKWVFVRKH